MKPSLQDETNRLRRMADRLIDDLQELSDRAFSVALGDWQLRSDLLSALSMFRRGAEQLDHAVGGDAALRQTKEPA